jgi:putative transposase
LKREYPGWGAPKIREKLRQQIGPPLLRRSAPSARSSIGTGWCTASGAARTAAGTALSRPTEPNALWCADYKGEFMLGNGATAVR